MNFILIKFNFIFQAVDVYLGFCYLNVILALIEYATVTYSKKKYDDRKKNKNKNIFELKQQFQAPDLLQGRYDKLKKICNKLYDSNKIVIF